MDNQYQQPTENINSGNEQQPQESSKSKGYLVIALFILALLVVGGIIAGYFFFVSPSNDVEIPTSTVVNDTEPSGDDLDILDWQTYKNEKLGIEFKYPDGYTAEIEQIFIEGESMSSQLTVVVFDNNYSYDESVKLSYFSVKLEPRFTNLEELRSDVEFEISKVKEYSVSISEIRDINVDEKNGFSYDSITNFPEINLTSNSTVSVVMSNPVSYRVSYSILSSYPGSKDKLLEIYQGIVSTIKFNPIPGLGVDDVDDIQKKGNDAGIISNVNQIKRELEINYSSNNNFLGYIIPDHIQIPDCSDDDQYEINIINDGKGFVVWGDFCFEDGDYCADSTGFYGSVNGALEDNPTSCRL